MRRPGVVGHAIALTLLVGALGLAPVAYAEEPKRDEVDVVVTELLDYYDDSIRSENNKKLSDTQKRDAYEEVVAAHTDNLFAGEVAVAIADESGVITLVELQDVHQFEMERTDKQLGAVSTASAATSAVEKAGIASLLGLALETGAITQAENKTGVTLSTSPYAFLMLGISDTPEAYEKYDLLRRLGVSGTFALDSSGDESDRNFDPSALTQFSAKYVLWGDRNPRSPDFHEGWKRHVLPLVERRAHTDAALSQAVVKLDQPRRAADIAKQEAVAAVEARLSAKGKSRAELTPLLKQDIVAAIKRNAVAFDSNSLDEAEKEAIRVAARNVIAARRTLPEEAKALDDLLAELERSPEVTAAYTLHRKDGDADYSELKVLAEFNTELVTLVGNASISLNHDRSRVPEPDASTDDNTPAPQGKKREVVRDYSITLSLEKQVPNFLPFRINAGGTNEITLSLNGKFMRLEDENDEIGVAQARVSIPLATGVDLPVSVTYATRSEYVDEDEIRGNFGISVDTDKLMSLAKRYVAGGE